MTYMEILRGRSFLESVSADIGYKYSWRDISGMISISSVNDTELLSLSITSYSAEDSYIICKSILDKAPAKMLSIFKRGDVEIIDDANMPLNPSKTSLAKMMLLGVVLGFIIAFAIVILIQMYDTRIRNIEELSFRYKISILGEIIN
jgi:capsular polysaccharide biosynthesis protein